jgi:hypothetical protein
MRWPHFRPRFQLPLDVPPEVFFAAVKAAVRAPDAKITAVLLPTQLELRIPEEEQRFFTPLLHVIVRKDEQDRGVLKARFAPHPHLWMLVISMYFTLALLALAGVMYAFSMWILGGSLWSLVAVPAMAALGGFTHGAVLIGQGLSADQMHVLRSALERIVEECTAQRQTQG